MLGQIFAAIIIIVVLTTIFGKWVLLAPLAIFILWLARQLADLFWWGKDKGKW